MDLPKPDEHVRRMDERRRARIRAKHGPMRMGIVEPKTNCRFCGHSFLVATAQRTAGFCMRHSRMGLPFVKRIGTPVVRGDLSDLETARLEFHSMIPSEAWEKHGDVLRWHWQRFEDAVGPGDSIRRFTSYTRDLRRRVYPGRGFICERSGEIIEGVITVVLRNAIVEMEDRAFMAACASSKELADVILSMPFEEDYNWPWEELMQ